MAVSVTAQNRVDVSNLYVALFGRAPDGEGLGYWASELANGKSLAMVANSMFNVPAARAYYPSFATNKEIIDSFYLNVLGRAPDAEGSAFWTAKLNAPSGTPGSVISEIIAAVINYTPSGLPANAVLDAAGTLSKTLFLNKATVALAYGLTNGSVAGAELALDGVTATPASVTAALAAFNAGQTVSLTVGLDNVNGTSGSDSFKANVSQNSLGNQVNTLGSGDQVKGGAGTDNLTAKITAGAFINGTSSDTMPIEPETKSVEIVKLQAVESAISGGSLRDGPAGNTQVFVNAKDMEDVTQMWSSRSDGDLTIQNMTTKGLASLAEQTLGMEYTGNADSSWGASDYTVYYDQDYLTAGTARTDALEIRIVNNLELKVNNKGLVAFEKVSFLVGGELITVDITPAIRDLTGAAAYNALVTAIQAQLTALNITGVTVSTLPVRTAVFTDDLIDNGITFPRGTESGQYTPILLTSTAAPLGRGQAQVDNTTLNFNGLNTQLFATDTADLLVTVNVALEKVGLAGDGGFFTAGSMNKTTENVWNAKTTVVDGTTSGIQQFNVSVGGDNTKSSSLAGLQSTNNNLQVVNVVSAANTLAGATFADLTIGNSNTVANSSTILIKSIGGNVQYEGRSYEVDRPDSNNQLALKDVQIFNAAAFKGNLDLTAALTEEVTAKYLNVIDNADNPAADNEAFVYTSGVGNDYINMYLDPANLEQPGSVTREDLTLTISTGLGNDEVLVSTGVFEGSSQGSGGGTFGPNWYENQHINANLKMGLGATTATGQLLINTGAGNDIVRTLGTGDYAVNAGDGVDTVYLDNSGQNFGNGVSERATWTVNDVNSSNLGDLLSQPALSAVNTPTKIANLSLNVSFKGFEAKAFVGGSNGSLTGVSVNDLTINQAIKAAINLDPVLNKLLIAEDGPGRTLVITSLIDGRQQDANLFSDVKLSLSNTALTPSQSAAFLLTPAQATALGFGTAISATSFGASLLGRFDADLENIGNPSQAISDNLVVGGLGNDVLVLGTGFGSNDTVGYAGFVNGTDTIVNFDTTFLPAGATVYDSTSFEIVDLVFGPSDGTPFAQTINFDGVTVNLAAPTLQGVIPAIDVASQFVNQYNAAAATNTWSAVYNGLGNVTLTRDIPGATPDLTAAAFTGTAVDPAATGGGVIVTPTVTTQGADNAVAGTFSTYTVTYTTATTGTTAAGDTSVTNPVALATGDGALSAATKAAAVPPAGYAAGAVVSTATTESVTFTATVAGATALPTDVSYGLDAASNLDGVNGTFAGTVGIAATTVAPVGTVVPAQPGPGLDKLDFTSYGVKAVFVGSSLVAGAVPVLGQTYIQMTESTTNAGEYTMSQLTEAGAVDTLVGVVGIADFGATQPFVSANFVI